MYIYTICIIHIISTSVPNIHKISQWGMIQSWRNSEKVPCKGLTQKKTNMDTKNDSFCNILSSNMVSFWVSWSCLNCFQKKIHIIYIYIYIFPKWWFTMGFESVKSTNYTNPRGIHFSKKNMAFLVGGFQLKKDATVKLDHFRAGVKTKNW